MSSIGLIQTNPTVGVSASSVQAQKGKAQAGSIATFSAVLSSIGKGANYSDDQLKSAFAAIKTPDAFAQQASSMGLDESQIQHAMQVCGVGGSDLQVMRKNIENWVGDTANGFTWDSNGAITALPKDVVRAQGTSGQVSGGMTLVGQYFTPQQIKDFYAQGGNLNQALQAQGVTDLWQIHSLNAQAQQIAGNAVPTGEDALKGYFKQYQQYNPNGAHANDYEGWKNDQDPVVLTSMMSGGYTGAVTALADSEPGGIYGPSSIYYGQKDYASGLGPRGMGNLGGGWNATGAVGSVGGTSSKV